MSEFSSVQIRTGIDIVEIEEFKKSMTSGGQAFLEKCFDESEVESGGKIGDGYEQHLAGIFAAKEAVMKALKMPTGSWHEIKVRKRESGRPYVELAGGVVGSGGGSGLELVSYDLSISHSSNYAVASFVAIIK